MCPPGTSRKWTVASCTGDFVSNHASCRVELRCRVGDLGEDRVRDGVRIVLPAVRAVRLPGLGETGQTIVVDGGYAMDQHFFGAPLDGNIPVLLALIGLTGGAAPLLSDVARWLYISLGGQTALNTAMALHKNGALERHDVEMIGAKPEADFGLALHVEDVERSSARRERRRLVDPVMRLDRGRDSRSRRARGSG